MCPPDNEESLRPTLDFGPRRDIPQSPNSLPDASAAKVGFVQGSSPRYSKEVTRLYRQRLQAFTLIFITATGCAFIHSLFVFTPYMGLRAACLAIIVNCYIWLRTKYEFSYYVLRALEVFIFCALLLQMYLTVTELVLHFAKDNDAVTVMKVQSIPHLAVSVLILVYGMLIPNTWKQAALIVFPIAAVPYLWTWYLRFSYPHVADILDQDKFGIPVPATFIAAFAAVYGSHLIHRVRREAFKARQFGQYRLLEKLGEGGMGAVYHAEHMLLKRPCAIKLIKPSADTDGTGLARFEREVKATAQLTHWNTVEIYDYGRTEDGTFYYVMELLPGMSLEDIVQEFGPLPPERMIHLMRQTCRALGEAHHAGLIHRDIKPANIFAAMRGGVYDVAKLLDFGLVRDHSRANHLSDMQLTIQGSFAGTPHYMSPEHAYSYSDMDGRSDIYALGAVMYFLLIGRPPFEGRNPMEILMAHSGKEPIPPRQIDEDIPEDVEAVVLRCLRKTPEERYANVLELEQALAACDSSGLWDDARARIWWKEHCGERN